MRSAGPTVLVAMVLAVSPRPALSTVRFDDGRSHTIDYKIDDHVVVCGDTSVTIVAGAHVTGTVYNNCGRITLLGGTVGVAVTDVAGREGFVIRGGKVLHGAIAADRGEIAIFGGSVQGRLIAMDEGAITIYGSDFTHGHGAIMAASGSVTGLLADGEPIDVPFSRGVYPSAFDAWIVLTVTDRSVAAGGAHGCAILPRGHVQCWGANRSAQSRPPPGVTLSSMDAGRYHTCGIRDDDSTIVCWGSNRDGRSRPPRGQFVQVSAGSRHACGIRSGSGRMACWGRGTRGWLAVPRKYRDAAFIHVSAGHRHTCGVLKEEGRAVCWGRGGLARLRPPTGQGTGYARVGAGHAHSCGIRRDGTLVCWGDDRFGQATPPTGVFTELATSSWFNCAIGARGRARCWGGGAHGRTSPPQDVAFESISVGMWHGCGVTLDGLVECWGGDRFGQSYPACVQEPTLAPPERGADSPDVGQAR